MPFLNSSAKRRGLRFGVPHLGRIAGQVRLELTQRRLVLGESRLRLVQCRLEGPLIDGEKQVALLDEVAFVEIGVGQLAGHLRLDRDRGVGLHVADNLNLHRDILGGCDGNGDRDISAAAAAPAAFTAPPGGSRLRRRSHLYLNSRSASTLRGL